MSEYTFPVIGKTNGKAPDALIDPQTGYQLNMASEEHDIHQGNAWEVSIESLALASGSVVEIQLSTGDNEVHMKNIHFWADAAIARMELLSNVTLTTGDAALVPVNRNQDPDHAKVKPADLLLFSNPTGISGGLLMETSLFGGGAGVGQSASAGSGDTGDEFILAKDTDNIIRLTNVELVNARNFFLSAFFYLNKRAG